jgi:hypothetical protein
MCIMQPNCASMRSKEAHHTAALVQLRRGVDTAGHHRAQLRGLTVLSYAKVAIFEAFGMRSHPLTDSAA